MNSHRTPNIQAVNGFPKAVEACFKDERWSLDACVGYFRAAHEFAAKEMVCTKTLYNYVDRGILKIKNIDLPQKLRRKPRKDTPTIRTNKKKYGRSIEERPTCVASRERFGDWELDLVIGSNSEKDHVLMTLLERKTRYYKVIRPPDKTSQSVMNAFAALKSEYGKDSPLYSRPLQQTTALSFPGLPSWNWKVKQRFTMHTRIPHMRKAPMSGTMVFCALYLR